jgi:hypothetical protein
VHVDVFQFGAQRNLTLFDLLTYFSQSLLNLVAFRGGQDADLGQHLSVRDRPGDVVSAKPSVKADAFGELFDSAIRGRLKDSTTGRAAHSPASKVFNVCLVAAPVTKHLE